MPSTNSRLETISSGSLDTNEPDALSACRRDAYRSLRRTGAELVSERNAASVLGLGFIDSAICRAKPSKVRLDMSLHLRVALDRIELLGSELRVHVRVLLVRVGDDRAGDVLRVQLAAGLDGMAPGAFSALFELPPRLALFPRTHAARPFVALFRFGNGSSMVVS